MKGQHEIARALGRDYARAGEPISACPFQDGLDDLARAFRQGYEEMERDEDVRESVVEAVRSLAAGRTEGEAAVSVFNPRRADHGWPSRHTAVAVVIEDMPFLVDSVLGVLSGADLRVHLLLHPQMVVRGHGPALRVLDVDQAPADDAGEEPARTESWIYLEVERLGRESQLEALRERTVIWALQHDGWAAAFDEVLELDGGRLVRQGAVREAGGPPASEAKLVPAQ